MIIHHLITGNWLSMVEVSGTKSHTVTHFSPEFQKMNKLKA